MEKERKKRGVLDWVRAIATIPRLEQEKINWRRKGRKIMVKYPPEKRVIASRGLNVAEIALVKPFICKGERSRNLVDPQVWRRCLIVNLFIWFHGRNGKVRMKEWGQIINRKRKILGCKRSKIVRIIKLFYMNCVVLCRSVSVNNFIQLILYTTFASLCKFRFTMRGRVCCKSGEF